MEAKLEPKGLRRGIVDDGDGDTTSTDSDTARSAEAVLSPFGPEVESTCAASAQLDSLQNEIRRLSRAMQQCMDMQSAVLSQATGELARPGMLRHKGSALSSGCLLAAKFKFDADSGCRREQKAAAELRRRETCGAKMRTLTMRSQSERAGEMQATPMNPLAEPAHGAAGGKDDPTEKEDGHAEDTAFNARVAAHRRRMRHGRRKAPKCLVVSPGIPLARSPLTPVSRGSLIGCPSDRAHSNVTSPASDRLDPEALPPLILVPPVLVPGDRNPAPRRESRESVLNDNPIFQAALGPSHSSVMLPEGPARTVLDCAMLAVVLVQCCCSAFYLGRCAAGPSFAFVLLQLSLAPCHAAWIWGNFSTAYLEGWSVVEKHSVIKRAYLLSPWCAFDFVTSVPWEAACYMWGGGVTLFRVALVLRTLCAVQLVRIFQVSDPVQDRVVWKRFLLAGAWVVLLVNYAACSWMLVAPYRDQGFRDAADAAAHEREQYIAALYWSLATLSTVGYGDLAATSPEARLLSITMMVLGVLGVAVGGAKLTQWMVVVDPYVLASDEKKRRFRAYMRHNEVPLPIVRSALEVYPVVLETSSTAYNNVVDELPQVLQDRIQQHVKLRLIRKVPIFSEISEACLSAIAEVTVLEEYALATNIIEYGELGREMFFLEHGIVEVSTYNKYGQQVWISNLKGGSFFGEVALLSEDCRRTATVRAVTSCTVYTLARESFDEVALLYSDLRGCVQAAGELRMCDTRRKSIVTDLQKAVQLALLLCPRADDTRARRRWKTATRGALASRRAASPAERGRSESMPCPSPATDPIRPSEAPVAGTFREPSMMMLNLTQEPVTPILGTARARRSPLRLSRSSSDEATLHFAKPSPAGSAGSAGTWGRCRAGEKL
eukprot:TRINITY_DN1903_c1_g1_i1.p1 TRINITY_DN1903_c1_g1~~TRINITY_DN1903_c1_g1_i1.p1  ORF type:complete len:888 (+),score=192.04 TRINITY_DN1903_c1_g1_i1:60-2723(+)